VADVLYQSELSLEIRVTSTITLYIFIFIFTFDFGEVFTPLKHTLSGLSQQLQSLPKIKSL
jgi:hypothetical protein